MSMKPRAPAGETPAEASSKLRDGSPCRCAKPACALRAAVGHLHRPEDGLLEPVAARLVELLVIRLTEAREREAERLDGLCEGVEQLLASIGDRVGHGSQTSPARPC